MVPEVGIAPTSPRLQRGANLPQLLGGSLAEPKLSERRLVVPAGNAPASSGYQPGALLLSYETNFWELAEGVGNAPTSARADPVFKTGAASLYLPAFQKWSGWQELHLRPPRSEQGRLLLTLHPEKWLPDLDSHQDKRLNRPPCYFDTTWQWRCRQDSHLHRSV
jgi:hypothetical protein